MTRKKIIFNRLLRVHVHKAIVWYLIRCGGAFHSGAYGEDGRYVKLFTDAEYGDHQSR